MNNYDRIWATVDLDAIKHNMAAMKANLREETKIIAVVKTCLLYTSDAADEL